MLFVQLGAAKKHKLATLVLFLESTVSFAEKIGLILICLDILEMVWLLYEQIGHTTFFDFWPTGATTVLWLRMQQQSERSQINSIDLCVAYFRAHFRTHRGFSAVRLKVCNANIYSTAARRGNKYTLQFY